MIPAIMSVRICPSMMDINHTQGVSICDELSKRLNDE
jgi:hypothetical protein